MPQKKLDLNSKPFNLRASVNELFKMDLQEAITSFSEISSKVVSKEIVEEKDKELVKGLERFIISQLVMFKPDRNIVEAISSLSEAIKHFENSGSVFPDLKDQANSILLYYKELFEIDLGNYNYDTFITVKRELEKFSKYLLFDDKNILMVEASLFCQGGLKNILRLEMNMAEIMFKKAGSIFIEVAEKYYIYNSKQYNYCMGVGKLQEGYSHYIHNQSKYISYDFEYFINKEMDSSIYIESLKFYSKAISITSNNELNANIEKDIRHIKALSLFLKVYFKIGKTMYHLLKTKNDSIELELDAIFIQIQTAKRLSIEIKDIGMINMSNTLELQLNNIAKFIHKEKELIKTKSLEKPIVCELRSLISKGNILKIFDEELYTSLIDVTDDYNSFNEVVLLSSRFYEQREYDRKGIISKDEFNTELNRIKLSFLEILTSLKTKRI